MNIYNLKIEIDADLYQQFFKMALDFKSRIIFIIRKKNDIKTEFLELIKPHIFFVRETHRWPGTISRENSVNLCCCEVTKDLVNRLKVCNYPGLSLKERKTTG